MRAEQKNISGTERMPGWLIVFSAVLGCCAAVYVFKNHGSFDPQVFQPWRSSGELAKAQPVSNAGTLIQQGLPIYTANCAICHQSTGLGDPQKAPPLPGAEWVLAPGGNRIARIMLDGFTGPVNIRGTIWNLNMPAWKANLNDEQIAAALSYIRNEWGNQASEIKPEEVRRVRQQTQGRAVPWTAEELLRIPEM